MKTRWLILAIWTDGVSREVYLINGQQPGPMIEVDEGDDVEVFVLNEISVETTIHWHGTSCLKCDALRKL